MANEIFLELEIGPNAAKVLSAALAAGPVASVLLRPDAQSGQTIEMRELVKIAQAHNCAALIAGDTRLACKLEADGVHLDWSPSLSDDYELARETLNPDSIIGIDAGQSRHDAMVLAELGADYVGFRPRETRNDEDDAATRAMRLDLVAWWTEVTQVPCVAFDATSADETRALISANADFIGIVLGVELTPQQAAARLRLPAYITAPPIRAKAGQ